MYSLYSNYASRGLVQIRKCCFPTSRIWMLLQQTTCI